MNKNKLLNIVIGSSKEQAKYAAVMLQSLFKNNKSEQFNIYFYYDEKMDKILEEMSSFVSEYNHNFVPVFVSEDRKKDLVINKNAGWHESVWYRYYCIEDLYKENERALILGTDVIVQKTIRDFYEMDLEDKCMAAVVDMGMEYNPTIDENCQKYGLNKSEYINADIELIDLKKSYGLLDVKKMIEYYKTEDFWFLDQDVLNFCYHDLIKVVKDYEYNFMPITAWAFDQNEYIRQLKKATFIHFAVTKPWRDYDYITSHEIWFSYAEKVPFYSEIMNKDITIPLQRQVEHIQMIHHQNFHIVKMDKLFWIQDLLWDACENGVVKKKMKELRLNKIAIYGYGKIGKHLFKYCQDNNIQVNYIIDSSKTDQIIGIPIIQIDNMNNYEVPDAIIITPIYEFEEIVSTIDSSKYTVYSLESIV